MTKKNRKNSVRSKNASFEGLPVVDGHEDIDLVINKNDVENSRKKDPNNCAAAMAGRRELKTDVRVYLTRTYVKDAKHERWVRFITPRSISTEIISFDRGASFEPGEYTLKAPIETQKLGYSARRGGIKTGTGKKRKKNHITTNVRVSAKEKMVAGSGK